MNAMHRLVIGLVVLAATCGALLLAACPLIKGKPTQPFTIAWSYDTSGYLETCGCSAHQLGGLARRATALKQLQQKQPLLAIEGAHFVADAGEFQLFKGETVLAVLKQMGYGAVQLGVREAQQGPAALTQLEAAAGVPCFCANLVVDGAPWATPSAVVEVAGAKVGITGASQPAAVSFELPAGVSFSDPVPALTEALAGLSGKCDLVVLCLEGERTWIDQLAMQFSDQAGLILSGDRNAATANYEYKAQPPQLNNYDQGRRLGVISADPAEDGFTLAATTLDLDDNVADDQAVVDYLDQTFRPQLKDRFFGKMKQDLEQIYLPPDSCKPCHEPQYATYTASHHFQALKTLYDKNQLYNPDCMTCHVVYDSNRDELQAMDCVSCHSNITEQHLWDAVNNEVKLPETPVTEYSYEWCLTCHDPENSLPFKEHWPQYVYQVLCVKELPQSVKDAAQELGVDPAAELPAE